MEQSKSYIDEDGDEIWYLPSKGKKYYHRLNGPAVIHCDGSKQWFVDGWRHRLDGPAVERSTGEKHWWAYGRVHRSDGPALEYANGSTEWYINGRKKDKKEIETWLKENSVDLTTPEGQMAFKLRWM